MNFLSKRCVYGLRATIYVAAYGQARPFIPIREVAQKLDISFFFLTKILQQLTANGLMEASRGPRGGVALGRDAEQRSVMDVVETLDGRGQMKACILGLAACSHRRPCPIQVAWSRQRATLFAVLEHTTLADLRTPGFWEQLSPAESKSTPAALGARRCRFPGMRPSTTAQPQPEHVPALPLSCPNENHC